MMSYLNLIPIGILLLGQMCSPVGNTDSGTHESVDSTTTSGSAISTKESPQDLLSFDADVKPILQSRCSPCHFPGGKMYDKMPFDKALTLQEHSEGILRRIKGDEGDKLKAFLEQGQNK